MMNHRIRALIADDQLRARRSLKALLTTLPQIEQVREAVNGCEGIRLVEESQPDLAIFDVRMPEMDGLEATRVVRARWPKIKIIILSMYEDHASDALAAGADAFFCKGEPPQGLLDTIDALTAPLQDQLSSPPAKRSGSVIQYCPNKLDNQQALM
jgi:DNA-binding NarL/FixJ family response regulator